jgi:hypothetical protein
MSVKLIHLPLLNGGEVWINPRDVTRIEPTEYHDGRRGCVVRTSDGKAFRADKTPALVADEVQKQ